MPQHQLKTLKDFDFENKKVFMRVDFNVPIHNQTLQDSHRIEEAFPSIEYIMEQGGKIVLASHLGRPKGQKLPDLSLKPVAEYLSDVKQLEVFFVEDCNSPLTQKLLKGLKKGQVILLENLRFHKEEEALDLNFAKAISHWADIYINEAFGISHREHTSISLLPDLITQKGLGFQFQKELEKLNTLFNQDLKKPFVVILGGSKLADKIPLIESFIDQADEFLIGGLMAYTFLKAQSFDVGQTYVENNSLSFVRDLIERLATRNKKLFLPVDFKGELKSSLTKSQKPIAWESFSPSAIAYDIGDKSIQLFQERIEKAGSVFWNGPMGFFEKKEYAKGTLKIAEFLNQNKQAYRVVGGGHSALAVKDLDIDHISTGGGASLSYLQDKTLIGLKKLYTVKRTLDSKTISK